MTNGDYSLSLSLSTSFFLSLSLSLSPTLSLIHPFSSYGTCPNKWIPLLIYHEKVPQKVLHYMGSKKLLKGHNLQFSFFMYHGASILWKGSFINDVMKIRDFLFIRLLDTARYQNLFALLLTRKYISWVAN